MGAELPSGNLSFVVVFLVHGLALFALGGAAVLSVRLSRATRFAVSLRYLAAFGFLGALASWLDAAFVLTGTVGPAEAQSLRAARVVVLALAGVSLLRFGTLLLSRTRRAHRWVLYVPWVLLGFWLFTFAAPRIGPLEGVSTAATSCVECHQAQAGALLASSASWLTSTDVWAHYLLYCPGAVLAAAALLTQRRRFVARGLPGIARHSVGAAAAFAVTAVTAGLVVAPAPFAPASLLNYASFHAALRIPTQLVTAVATVFVAYSVVRMLSVFEIEHARQLARANAARFAAQREMLEAQARAQAALADWNRQLEGRVAERTRELEELHARLKDVAVLEERDRIARELHDSLAQALGYLGLRASVLEELIGRGEVQEAASEARSMAEVADDAYADVREAILGLRVKTSRQGLVAALREYLRKYGLQNGIRAELEVQPDAPLALAPSVEIQLLRVVQEALANVRKHARAERVLVRIWIEDGATCLSVEDDGRGFDASHPSPSGHFGIATMRERVEEVDGKLTVESAPGAGTSVVVCLPGSRRSTAGKLSATAIAGPSAAVGGKAGE